MTKIQQLHTFLIGLNLFAAENISSVMDDLRITPALRPGATLSQLVMCEKDYLATFNIDDLAQSNGDLLLANLSKWLAINNADSLNPSPFDMTIEILNNDKCNVEFSIPFNEVLLAEQSSNGPLMVDGIRFALVTV
jgi:hypothetical protein